MNHVNANGINIFEVVGQVYIYCQLGKGFIEVVFDYQCVASPLILGEPTTFIKTCQSQQTDQEESCTNNVVAPQEADQLSQRLFAPGFGGPGCGGPGCEGPGCGGPDCGGPSFGEADCGGPGCGGPG